MSTIWKSRDSRGIASAAVIDAEDNATGVDVDFDDHASYALIVNWPADLNTEYEVFLSRQSTSLDTDESLFLPGEPVLDDLDISYLQVAAPTFLKATGRGLSSSGSEARWRGKSIRLTPVTLTRRQAGC